MFLVFKICNQVTLKLSAELQRMARILKMCIDHHHRRFYIANHVVIITITIVIIIYYYY